MAFNSRPCSALALLATAVVSVGSMVGQCTTAAQAGDYLMTCDGYVAQSSTAPLIPTKLLGLVSATTAGSLSGSGTASIGGKIVTSSLSGTSSVNSNCTGSAVINQTISGQSAPSLVAGIGITDSGNTIDALVIVPNFVLSCHLKRIVN